MCPETVSDGIRFVPMLRTTHRKLPLCLLRVYAAQLDEGPEGGVVEIVDVAIHLSPTHIVPQVLYARVAYGSAVEAR